MAFVTYGGFAAGSAAEQLAAVAIELRMIPVRDQVNIRLIGVALDEHGMPTEATSSART